MKRALAVPPEVGRVVFSWRRTLWLHGMIAAAIVWGRAAPPSALALSAGLALVTLCLGHSVGVHRGVIHRAYRCSPWLRRVLAYLFVHTGIGGPVAWIRVHYYRDHWQNEGEADCPPFFAYRHSLIEDLYWNLHCTFLPRDPERYRVPVEDERDPWLQWLQRTWPLHCLGLAALLAVTAGPAFAATCVCARVATSILGHWFVGYMAHKHGSIRYAVPGAAEIGRNTLVLGWLSFGEGFHNNHHAYPRSARMGHAWYELDLGWLAIRALAAVGLVRDVRGREQRR
jgi:stearoyl-CoA desaturase (delta-9 desaturase)